MIKLFTHTDLDGVGCAILARLAYKEQVDIEFFHNPDELNKYLAIFSNVYNKVIITDLSCNKEFLYKWNNVFLFDHHKSALDLNNNMNYIVKIELNNHLTCGTELFYHYLVSQALIIQDLSFFIELIRLYDTWEWITNISKLPYFLNNLLYVYGINKFINKYVNILTNKDINELNIFTEQDKLLLSYQESQINKYINNKLQHVLREQIAINNKKYSIGICFADRYQSLLGIKINTDIVMIIDINTNTCSLRTNRDDLDLSLIIKKINKNGGGHKKAAGCKLDDTLKNYICSFLCNKLDNKVSI